MSLPATSAPQRTAPLSVALGALASVRGAIVSAVAIAFSGIGGEERMWLVLGIVLAGTVIGTALAFVKWQRLTYIIGAQDIRVESGVLSRAARSVPFERIQDVSLEARPLPRLLGLVSVKFETGAGGGDDLALEYLTTAQGEALRRLVRARREDAPAAPGTPAEAADGDAAEVLYALTPGRLMTFGLFEFSLAVFAVLGGLLQYVDTVSDIDVWYGWLKQQGSTLVTLGPSMQALGALAGLLGLLVVGSVTGIVRTVLRDWGFTLTRSARGFRRQRGLLTRTDVVMPAHRVQGLVIGTGLVRYRFGWHGLSFVSLAQDAEDESHVVAPFATMSEIARIVAAAGFRLPDEATAWRRADKRYRLDRMLDMVLACLVFAVGLAIWAPFGLAFIALGLGVVAVAINLHAWEFRRIAIDEAQVFATTGWLSPDTRIVTRMKLHSVEIAQGPLARLRGYATLHLGLAGGSFSFPGLPLAEARAVRAAILATIAATDYSRLDAPRGEGPDQASSDAQSGFSAKRLAT